jgi:hypothetical protein
MTTVMTTIAVEIVTALLISLITAAARRALKVPA